jgi:hypothetical protein
VNIGPGLTPQEMANLILNDPLYLYQRERLLAGDEMELRQARERAALAGGGGGGGYVPDYSKLRALATQQTAEQKAEAERDAATQALYNRERRASMGQASSGTGAVEEDNDAKELSYLLGQLNIGLEQQLEQYNMSEKAARAAAAQASAAAARARASAALSVKQLEETIKFNQQGQEYTLLTQAGARVVGRWWDESSGVYRGPNGITLTPEQAAALLGQAIPPPTGGV